MPQPIDSNQELFPLAQAQIREWDYESNPQRYPTKNIGCAVLFPLTIDYDHLQTAVNHLIRVNEGMRLQFVLQPAEDQETEAPPVPMQYVVPYQPLRLPLMDFSAATNPREAFDHWFRAVFQQPFNLIEQPMYEFYYVRLDDRHTGLLAKVHHVIADGYAVTFMLRSLLTYYQTLASGNRLSNELNPSYLDFVIKEKRYLGTRKCQRDREYWLEAFKDLDQVNEHYLYNHPGFVKGARELHRFSPEVSDRLLHYLHDNRLSLNGFFNAAAAIYHAGRTGHRKALIGTIIFNRPTLDDKNTVGQYISKFACRINVKRKLTAGELLRRVDEDLMIDMFPEYPYNYLMEDLNLAERGYTSLYRYAVNCYTLNYLDGTEAPVAATLPGLEVKESYTAFQNNSCQMIVNEDEQHVLYLTTDYKVEEYSQAFIQTMHRAIEQLADAISADDSRTLADLMNELTYPESDDLLN